MNARPKEGGGGGGAEAYCARVWGAFILYRVRTHKPFLRRTLVSVREEGREGVSGGTGGARAKAFDRGGGCRGKANIT